MAQPFNLGNSFLGKSTIELVNPDIADSANNRTEISVDADGDLFFQRYKDGAPKGNLKFPVHSYGQSEKKDMHTDANGDIRFANTWTAPIVGLEEGGGASAAGPAFYSKELENACLFDGSSHLSRNFESGGDTNTWTWSGWVKRSSSGEQFIFGTGSASDQGNYYYYQFGGDNVGFANWSGSINVSPNNLLRDTSSWYHLVLSFTSTNIDIFINGNEYGYTRDDQPSSSTSINSNREHYIGIRSPNMGYLNGYMANIQFIDGQALDANAFGTYREGVWIPKQYGTGDPADAQAEYGTNGFHLDFSDADDLGKDVSGKNNHWT
jgi:hypothetical protein